MIGFSLAEENDNQLEDTEHTLDGLAAKAKELAKRFGKNISDIKLLTGVRLS